MPLKGFMDLKESWAITKRHLETGVSLLPENVHSDPEAGSVERFKDYIEHNELELALDELEGLGEANPCGPSFWKELLVAAETMQLSKQAERYRSKLKL